MSEGLALLALALCLAATSSPRHWAPDWLVAAGSAGLLLATGILTPGGLRYEVGALGPTVGFLGCLLVLADGCRRAGLFTAVGAWIAYGAGRSPTRFLAMVVAAASLTTVVLSLDATIVLLTPIVLETAKRLRTDPRPSLYACAHLANSGSLLLPISNLTNLLAFRDAGISFTRFAALMALPWVVAIAVEWVALRRVFGPQLRRLGSQSEPPQRPPSVPAFPLAIVALTLLAFAVSSSVGVAPAWVAAAGAAALAAKLRTPAGEVARAAAPSFLVFVLGLGLVVHAAGVHGLSSVIGAVLPGGSSLPVLLVVCAVSAGAANLVNNLPATLIILPVISHGGAGAVLAMLIGVNVGPNLTYFGSLATLLWRQVLRDHGESVELERFTRLGLVTVPPILTAATAALWIGLQVF